MDNGSNRNKEPDTDTDWPAPESRFRDLFQAFIIDFGPSIAAVVGFFAMLAFRLLLDTRCNESSALLDASVVSGVSFLGLVLTSLGILASSSNGVALQRIARHRAANLRFHRAMGRAIKGSVALAAVGFLWSLLEPLANAFLGPFGHYTVCWTHLADAFALAAHAYAVCAGAVLCYILQAIIRAEIEKYRP